MRVTIFGSGYVGLVTGVCLADAGNHVICVDVDAAKIERLKRGEVPIHEPGLDALIKRNAEAGRIEFTTDAPKAVEHGLFQLIAVGTPPLPSGEPNLTYLEAAANAIGAASTPSSSAPRPSRNWSTSTCPPRANRARAASARTRPCKRSIC